MATKRVISGGDVLLKRLEEISKSVKKASQVEVGFLENADYPDGTKVANVAAINNFGAPAASIPPRPFFSNMVAEKSATWPESMVNLLKANDYDSRKVMALMGEGMKAQLQQAIRDMNSPALSPVTLAVRKWRKNNPGRRVTGSIVGQLAREVAAGTADTSGVATKPLIDSAHMINSVDYEVL